MATSFWEIAGLAVSVAQMALHLIALDNYKDRLEQMAVELKDWADLDKIQYLAFRASDPAFYAYYMGLPDYGVCENNIIRAKGAAYKKYGNAVRNSINSTRGFTPLADVHLINTYSYAPLAETAVSRAQTHIQEHKRVDDHVLERWHAIVSAPVGREAYAAGNYNTIINQSFKSLTAEAQGFNAAGVSFGNYLYQILN